jgi:hypothetical protein
MSAFFQPAAKRARVDGNNNANSNSIAAYSFGDLDPSSIFDDAFPLSNYNNGNGNGGHGASLRLSNPWLLSQMRRASLSAFMDTQAMSNMMFPGSTNSKSSGGNGLIVPTLDGPADRDEIFKTGDSVIFGSGTMNGMGGGMSGIDSDPNSHIWGLGEDNNNQINKDPATAMMQQSLANLQYQQQHHQQQQHNNQQQMYAGINKRSATTALLDAHNPLQQYMTSNVVGNTTNCIPTMMMTNTTTAPTTPVSPLASQGGKMTIGGSNNRGMASGATPDDDDAASNVRFRSHQAENWTEKYEVLLDYRLKNGHCMVPNQYTENPPLAEWVKRQRYQVSFLILLC